MGYDPTADVSKGETRRIGFSGWRPSVSSGTVRNMPGMKCNGGWSITRPFMGTVMFYEVGMKIISRAAGCQSKGTGGRRDF